MRLSPFLLLLLAAETPIKGDWGYDRCSAEGPSNWPNYCSGRTEQSPINLCGAQTLSKPPMLYATGYATARTMTIMNTKSSIQIGVTSGNPSLQVGNLSVVVGRSTNSSITWNLEQVHFHWGRQGLSSEGSEHYMEGRAFPFEAHLVHYSTQFSSVVNAVGSGRTDAILVVGVLFDIGPKDLDILKVIGPRAPDAQAVASLMNATVRLSDLFDWSGDFYFYGGSLTTPPCTEDVTWIVMKDRKTITSVTLEYFKAVTKQNGTLMSAQGNFRPLQNVNDRTIYSTGGFSSPCGDLSEVGWDCPSTNQTLLENSGTGVPFLLATILPTIFLTMVLSE